MGSVLLFLEDWAAAGKFGTSAGVLTEILLTDSDPIVYSFRCLGGFTRLSVQHTRRPWALLSDAFCFTLLDV